MCTLFHCCFPTGDFNRQLMSQMMQMNQILGDVKDLLRQQVLYKDFSVKSPMLATSVGSVENPSKQQDFVRCLRCLTRWRKNNQIVSGTGLLHRTELKFIPIAAWSQYWICMAGVKHGILKDPIDEG